MKCFRQDYSEAPFFYKESTPEAEILVVWHNTEKGQREVIEAIIATMGDNIEYLFKEEIEPEAMTDAERFLHINGGLHKAELMTLFGEFEQWIFNDSSFQLCLREPGASGYVAYDEHGVIYIYGLPNMIGLLTRLGILNMKKELISAKPYWSGRDQDETAVTAFKKRLKESSVFCVDESESNTA